ncbi:LysR substrate-binding domain-containing protein [Elioraea sp.]|jgi:DNA-binding transcriptional LysR family regulator|uniref:LysR substrate-binding domain-containing protein n=1 Tax=Elioraea sp. TaxID=2185103 RepID=UPI0021DBC00B|nr:LysR substrate-binding domain-containing protein [Elioraea sp.]GIX08336.1 MAG: transcriptional regulator [Elioraea sp.]
MPLNPRQVEAFRALMLTGSTVRAAEMMKVTQPAVSRLLRSLQDGLGLVLFERRGSRLVPTPEAMSLYNEVERSFVGLDRIAAAAAELRSRRAGVLRIAALPALANGFLPRFVGQFLVDRPKLDLGVYGLLSHLVLDWVASGQCDLGFAASALHHPAVTARPLIETRMVAVVPSGHRLARRRRLGPQDFAEEDFVSLSPGASSRHQIDAVFAAAGVRRRLRIETPLSEILCGIVASGAAVGIADIFTAREYEGTGLVVRPFEPPVTFSIAAVWATHRGLSAVAREFLEAFAAQLRQAGR